MEPDFVNRQYSLREVKRKMSNQCTVLLCQVLFRLVVVNLSAMNRLQSLSDAIKKNREDSRQVSIYLFIYIYLYLFIYRYLFIYLYLFRIDSLI